MERDSNLHDERLMKNSVLFNRLLKYMKGYYKNYILAIILMALLVGLDLLIPFMLGKVLEELGEDVINFKWILTLVLTSVGLLTASKTLSYVNTMLLCRTSNKIVFRIREIVLEHIQKMSHSQFNNIPIGKLVTRATNDVNTLFDLYNNVLLSLLRNTVTIIGVFVAMFLINSKLALILLIIVPILFTLAFIFRYFSRRAHRKVRERLSNMNAFLSENISGMKITQVFNEEDKKYKEFYENNQSLKKSYIHEIFVFGIFRPSIFLLYILSIGLVLWFGGNEAIDVNLGVIAVGLEFSELYMFTNYVSRFFNPIQSLADQFNQLQSAFASAEKIYSILDTPSEIEDSEDAVEIDLTGDIEFKDVWFYYVPGEWVLKGVSFHIHPNDTIAFVGATGSGKTTILSLITRNYDIQRGEILINGIDIKKIKLECLRRQVGQMLQDVFLFSGTVETNISMNDPAITHEEVVEASKYVNASKFIDKLTNGYDEETRERGNNFSLGQRQLISFARTIVHKPKVMILDEATSNIDTETEVLIQDSLNKIMALGTVIVVAHRLSTIQHATCIYVFQDGEIIESGTHQELLANHGRYYKLYLLQFDNSL